jgi:hypothetical protein
MDFYFIDLLILLLFWGVEKKKIVETEIFSVDERIKIMSEIFVIERNDEKEST